MNESIKLPRPVHLYLITLIIINIFSLSTVQPLKDIGYYSIRLTLISAVVLFIYYLINGFATSKLRNIYITIAGFMTIQAISFYLNSDSNYLLFFYVTAVFIFIIFSIQIEWDRHSFIGLGYIISILILILFIDWDWGKFDSRSFTSIFRNPNALAIFIFCSLYFQIIAISKVKKIGLKIYFLLILFISLILLLATNSRSVLIAGGVVIIVSIIQFYKPTLVKYAFWLAMTFNITFLFVYVKLYNTAVGSALNNLSINLFNKRFFSGREKIWYDVWQHIESSFFFGYGISATARPLNEGGLTAHNQYLQTFLETGLIGFIVFCLFLFFIWLLLLKSQHTIEGRLSASFFIAILIYSTFELTLFQNNFQIGLIQWTIVVTGINFLSKEHR
ncbi:MAG TPA: O-antigen ligase family protein [Bacilli bacterium]|nr:O-antigen ligase family protein [Bacilli bacterium]